MKIKVAEIGMGGISGAHVPAWNRMEDVELVAICDIRPEMMDRYDGHITARKYTDFDEMLAQEEFDVLDITLPTYLHADYAVKALERGIHVVSEKPISLRREDVARVYGAAEKNGKFFMVAHVLRFWPEYLYLKDCMDSGRFGKLVSGTMTRIGAIPVTSWDGWMQDPERSGMVPFDLHIHDLDFLVYTLGKPEVEHIFHGMDYMHTIYRYGDIRIACESAWFHAPVPFQATFRMQFEKAVLEFTGGALKIFKEDWTTSTLDMASSVEEGNYIPQSDGYYNELRYFIDCVKEGKKPEIVKPHELETVLDTIAIINAAK
ncbi:MAG: Gfo/Idh/MocA family oxidoreductase [Ruminococcaceae bacterium]|nr:Gfo/Idh/MocA family oxidoreductase [Oscillospiraceae bacterium]